MSGKTAGVIKSSVFRKQMIALTGLAMVGFVIGHLSGNLLFYAGPDAFNGYAHKLASLGPLLWVVRLGLLSCVLLHMDLTMRLVLENARARPVKYHELADHGDRKWATRTMKYSGILIVLFIILHLIDFTFADKIGPRSVVEGVNGGESLELFGVVWNSYQGGLLGGLRVGFYVLAVSAVGLHLSHAIQSVFQTFGFNHERYTPIVKVLSIVLGVIVAVGFASIPIVTMLASEPFGV